MRMCISLLKLQIICDLVKMSRNLSKKKWLLCLEQGEQTKSNCMIWRRMRVTCNDSILLSFFKSFLIDHVEYDYRTHCINRKCCALFQTKGNSKHLFGL